MEKEKEREKEKEKEKGRNMRSAEAGAHVLFVVLSFEEEMLKIVDNPGRGSKVLWGHPPQVIIKVL